MKAQSSDGTASAQRFARRQPLAFQIAAIWNTRRVAGEIAVQRPAGASRDNGLNLVTFCWQKDYDVDYHYQMSYLQLAAVG
jgi:hypothetical protein